MQKHECKACLNYFEPDTNGWLYITKCPKFVGARMDLRYKNGLNRLYIGVITANLADLKLPDWLQNITIADLQKADFSDLKLPDELNTIWLENLQTANLADLKLPCKLKRINLYKLPTTSLADLKLPDGLKQIRFQYLQSANVEAMLVENGYYDENYLQRYQEKDDVRIINVNWTNCYKRLCLNLNWLFEEIYGWDWNLNIVIDNYCGFELDLYCLL